MAVRCSICTTVHDDAQLIHANFTQPCVATIRNTPKKFSAYFISAIPANARSISFSLLIRLGAKRG